MSKVLNSRAKNVLIIVQHVSIALTFARLVLPDIILIQTPIIVFLAINLVETALAPKAMIVRVAPLVLIWLILLVNPAIATVILVMDLAL